MTTPESDTLAAGRELDERVATEVLGYVWVHDPSLSQRALDVLVPPHRIQMFIAVDFVQGTSRRPRPGMSIGDNERFSQDIAAAWQVVEHLVGQGWSFDLEHARFEPWTAQFSRLDGGYQCGRGDANTAPLAICLAALHAAALMKETE